MARDCERGCAAFAWESATSLLVLDAGALYRVAPPAAPVRLGTKIDRLVVAGP